MAFLKPERFFRRVSQIDIERDIVALGFTHVLLDVDNTIRSRADGSVPRDVRVWLEKAAEAGVVLCLFSNSWHERVFELGCHLDLPVIAKALKPLPFAYVRARCQIGCPLATTVAIGDQLLTDVCGAHLVGAAAYLVDPLSEADLRHTVFLRRIERRLMGSIRAE